MLSCLIIFFMQIIISLCSPICCVFFFFFFFFGVGSYLTQFSTIQKNVTYCMIGLLNCFLYIFLSICVSFKKIKNKKTLTYNLD